MSRSSPGRYSLHDFAKNVYDVHVFAADGRELETTRPDPYGWNVAGHGGGVTVKYKVFGDRVDGTYLARRHDARAHQHAGGDHVGARARRSAGRRHLRAAGRHALAGGDAAAPGIVAAGVHRAEPSVPDGQPVGVRSRSPSASSRSARAPSGFRCTTPAPPPSSTATLKDVEKIVRQEGAIYGEFPEYEPGHYTFLADYLPYANGDGMEHRNSTVITSAGSIASTRERSARHGRARVLPLLERRAHPAEGARAVRFRSREPVRRALAGRRVHAVLRTARDAARAARGRRRRPPGPSAGLIETVAEGPGHLVRSAEEMSRMAPFIDGGRSIDRTNWSTTVISYYPYGGAIALALDLTLRDRTDGRLSLDDFMRAMWTTLRQAGRQPRRLRRSSVHDRRRGGDAGGGQRRSGVRARLLRPLHPGARGRRLPAPAAARRVHDAQTQPRDARGSAICA